MAEQSKVGREDDEASHAMSVGMAFERNEIYSVNHPGYISFSEAVTERLTKSANRETVRKSSAKSVLLTEAVTSREREVLVNMYPEFALSVLPLNLPGHAMWVASRRLANEWIVTSVSRYGDSILHFGGSLLSTMAASRRGVHLESDVGSEVAAHEAHTGRVDVLRVYQDYASVVEEYGEIIDRREYDEYLRRRSYRTCLDPDSCTHQVDAMAVDLSMSAMSPFQVAVAMLQHGAQVCHGFLPYHPDMLVRDHTELGSTGVWFKKSDRWVTFEYPEGRAGVESYPRASWAAWLTSHCFSVGRTNKSWFQLELLKNRGWFMFFRIVRVNAVRASTSIVHALDLPSQDDYMLVKSWSLRSISSDPKLAASWERCHFLARSRVVNRVFEFAMQLDKKTFTRFAIKKQIRIVNNRWVVSGTSVTVCKPLDPREIEDLTTAVYAKAFVSRYESSTLSSEMMGALKKISGFTSFSTMQRVCAVGAFVVSWIWDRTFAPINFGVRTLCDWLRGFLDGKARHKAVMMDVAPTYVTLRTAVASWRSKMKSSGEVLFGASDTMKQLEGLRQGMATSLTLAVMRETQFVQSVRVHADDLVETVRLATDVVDTRVSGDAASDVADSFVTAISSLNELDHETEARHHMSYETQVREDLWRSNYKITSDPDPVGTLSHAYSMLFPSVVEQNLEHDTFSLSLDPQDRVLAAPHLRMNTYFGLPPVPKSYYRSKLRALSVPKRQNTAQELLSAVVARNLSAPSISQPQERDVTIAHIWAVFLDEWCVADAGAKLMQYQSDPVAMGEDALRDWASQAKPGVVDKLVKEMEKQSESLGDKRVNDYLIMLKADVKPTLSNKPVETLTAPQVIVYHEKALSAMYSSMYRVLVRRFLSLLKPTVHVNLLKDLKDIRSFVQARHPFGMEGLKYLENDFSKFDKSQGDFVFDLEAFVFGKLGFNREMLEKWAQGHVECSLRSVNLGMSLSVMYQRKSGDATTAFGNVILNVLSVSYAYSGTPVIWALFMGDDSLICTRRIVAKYEPVTLMAEVFNLSAKNYITDAPYYASTFLIIDDVNGTVAAVPDPIKRMERLSMHISAVDPQWEERFQSYKDALDPYTTAEGVVGLARCVTQRYEIAEGSVNACASALGTLASDFNRFRDVWAREPELVQG